MGAGLSSEHRANLDGPRKKGGQAPRRGGLSAPGGLASIYTQGIKSGLEFPQGQAPPTRGLCQLPEALHASVLETPGVLTIFDRWGVDYIRQVAGWGLFVFSAEACTTLYRHALPYPSDAIFLPSGR